MKLFLVFASLVLAISATNDEDLWTKFKADHAKTYRSLREDKLRFGVFKSNLRTIAKHNEKYAKGEETWYMGINQFSDITDEEFQAQYLRNVVLENIPPTGRFVLPSNASVPDAIDWREKGAVLSVKNQMGCGSCWAFSAVGSIEGQNALKNGVKTNLSTQELVDCSWSYSNYGCYGGRIDNAFKYIKDHGISKLSDYRTFPYPLDLPCLNPNNSAGINLTGFIEVGATETELKNAIGTVGPVSVAINADYIKNYSGGIFNNSQCPTKLNHAGLAVGYGTENKNDYWIFKNSWGASWGDKGYIKMTRNRSNQCGIASEASYPVLA